MVDSCRGRECSPKLALQGEFGFAELAAGRRCRGQSRASRPAASLGLLAAGITRGRGVITAQRPRTRSDRGQASPGGLLGGGSAECCEGTVPTEATLAVMPSGSWLRCSAIKIGLGSRPAGEALPVLGLAMAKQREFARWGASVGAVFSSPAGAPAPRHPQGHPMAAGAALGAQGHCGLGRAVAVWEVRGCGRVLLPHHCLRRGRSGAAGPAPPCFGSAPLIAGPWGLNGDTSGGPAPFVLLALSPARPWRRPSEWMWDIWGCH